MLRGIVTELKTEKEALGILEMPSLLQLHCLKDSQKCLQHIVAEKILL